MKHRVLIFFVLWLSTLAVSAQTIHHGQGVVSVQNGDRYKLTRNLKSDNGGSVSMTFTGLLKNGKRDGVWKLTSTYNNYGGGNGYYFTGTATMTRTYSEGILNGPYTLSQKIKQRTGAYNPFKGGWVYGPVEDGSEHVSGSFKNGKPTGKWVVNGPLLKCTFELSNGTPIGEVNVTKTAMGGGIKARFRDGYLVFWKPLTNEAYVEGLSWDESEDLKSLPDQNNCNLLEDFTFLEDYMRGSDFQKWIYGYPKGSSEEKFSIPYKIADKESHKKDFGTPPEDVQKMRERSRIARLYDSSWKLDNKYSGIISNKIKQYQDSLPDWLLDIKITYNLTGGERYTVSEFFKQNPDCLEFALKNKSDSVSNSNVKEWYDYQQDYERYLNYDNYFLNYLSELALKEADQYHINTQANSTEFFDIARYHFRPKIGNNDFVFEANSDKHTFLAAVCPDGKLVVHIDPDKQNNWRRYLEKQYIEWAKDSLPIGDKERDLYLIDKFITKYTGNKDFIIKEKDASNVDFSNVREYIIKSIKENPDIMDFDKGKLSFSYLTGGGNFVHFDVYTVNEVLTILEKKKKFRKLRETFPKSE